MSIKCNDDNLTVAAAILTAANVVADKKAFLEPSISNDDDREVDPKQVMERYLTYLNDLKEEPEE
jgi:hypothetical protein